MTSTQTRILEIIRAHPEGITTVDIAVLLGQDPRAPGYAHMRNKVNTRCRSLEKYGLISRSTGHREGSGPHTINLWTVVE